MATITGQLTSAQIKALHSSPIQIIAAPGVGKAIVPTLIVASLKYGGSNPFVAAASQVIGAYYSTTESCYSLFTAPYISQSVSMISSGNASLKNQTSRYENLALNFYNPSATEISGNAANDNVMNYTIVYEIIDI